MDQRRLVASNRMVNPVGMMPPDSASLTFKDVIGILRRHLFLIFILIFKTFQAFFILSVL